MKIKNLLFYILMITGISYSQTTVNGEFTVNTNDGSVYSIEVWINTNTGTDGLGSSNFVFNYDNTNLSFPTSPVSGTDYVFHNFSGGSYNPGTVTWINPNQISINIDLSSTNGGTIVSGSPNWTDVVTIKFSTTNSAGSSGLVWQKSDMVVFDQDQSTPWQLGTFTDLNTTPLPVQLSSFTALANNNTVNLTWNTATEVNNYGFDVQRMTEGSPNSDWTKVGFVAGSGNSNSPKTYSFTDNNLTGGTKFLYRLKQTDIDGSFEYSDTVEVTIAAQYALYQNYPNPFNPTTIIKFDIPQASRVSLIIYNILGAKVATLVNNESLSAGLHSATFDGRSLASGTYIYRLQAGNYVQIKKMLLLK
jgi:Secretion system C-terminal sorting domain